MNSIQVLLADDHILMRAGLRLLVESFAGFEVVAEASDGREAVQLARQHKPDVILLDIGMPGLNGLDAVARIAKVSPRTQIIILSMHIADSYVLAALRAGAVGYVVKYSAVDELERALRAVHKGERWFSPAVSRHLLDDYLRLARHQPAVDPEPASELLTPRQREILQLIAEGHTTREMAERLSISAKTIETHRLQIMERLNIHDIAGLTRFAIRIGLVDPEF